MKVEPVVAAASATGSVAMLDASVGPSHVTFHGDTPAQHRAPRRIFFGTV